MKLRGNAYVYIIVLVISLFMILWSLFGIPYGLEPKLLPVFFGSIVFLLAAIGLWNEIRAGQKQATTTEGEKGTGLIAQETWRGYLVHSGWVVGFLLGIYLLGYLIAIPIFVLSYMKRLGTRWLVAIISTIVVWGFIYAAFEIALDLKLYRGLLLTWLGD